MIVGTEKLYSEARESLQRIQDFDAESLRRTEDLGAHLHFGEAVEPANRLIELFRRLSLEALQDFPDPTLNTIKDQANSVYNIFKQALEFSPASSDANPKSQQQTILKQLISSYPSAFQVLHPFISYSLHRTADFQRLDTEARATLQSVEDRVGKFSSQMQGHEKEAKRILDEIRNVAAQEGVIQQASHFRAESESHELKAEEWRGKTVRLAWVLGVFALLSIVIHKIPGLEPKTVYDTIQLAISKVLVFFVITYMLVLSARNFMSHKHNAVVNKHRQNALMTHRALVEGTSDGGARDAVMVHAASCIFAPQPTGYSQQSGDGDSSGPRSVVELASRSAVVAAKSSS